MGSHASSELAGARKLLLLLLLLSLLSLLSMLLLLLLLLLFVLVCVVVFVLVLVLSLLLLLLVLLLLVLLLLRWQLRLALLLLLWRLLDVILARAAAATAAAVVLVVAALLKTSPTPTGIGSLGQLLWNSCVLGWCVWGGGGRLCGRWRVRIVRVSVHVRAPACAMLKVLFHLLSLRIVICIKLHNTLGCTTETFALPLCRGRRTVAKHDS